MKFKKSKWGILLYILVHRVVKSSCFNKNVKDGVIAWISEVLTKAVIILNVCDASL
jgi:hypothetical protein